MTTLPDPIGSDRFVVAKDVHVRHFDDEMILLDLSRGDYFALNEVGARIWSGLADGRSPEEITRELAKEYDADKETLMRDCLGLLQDLLRDGLVSRKVG